MFPFYTQCLETRQGFRRERYYPQIGKWLDVAGSILDDGLLLVFSDITAHKSAELALQQTNLLLQTIIDSIHTGINPMSPEYDGAGNLIDFTYDLVNTTVGAASVRGFLPTTPTVILTST